MAPVPATGEYAFLLGPLIDGATLAWAEAEAQRCGVPTHAVLLASGRVSDAQYAAALAAAIGVPAVRWDCPLDAAADHVEVPADTGLSTNIDGRRYRVLSATEATPQGLRNAVWRLRERGIDVALAPQSIIDAALEARTRRHRLDRAVRGLLREQPDCSAGARGARWQLSAAILSVGIVIGGIAVLPQVAIGAATALLALPFLCVTLLRLAALQRVLGGTAAKARTARPRTPDAHLPIYSVLVPLLREADVLASLIASLRALDYPPAKLDIILVLEAGDTETQAGLLALQLPGNVRTVIVPHCEPRTKPKALNYALQFARGDFIVVYDAEDRPQPDQIRRALHVFQDAPPELGCLQAQLNIYNPFQGRFFTRQFTIEYCVLFDAILPALERLRLPVPLGGTSNHLPRAVLESVGGWDPFNVTEDADLGIRLARRGYHTAVLASTTWEEAPPTLRIWLGQRTRWLKGWMQTYLVHTRHPLRLAGELGVRASIGFHVLMGGLMASTLAHPLVYALIGYHWLSGELLAPAETTSGAVLWSIAWINLAVGYAVSILLGVVSAWRRGLRGLALFALLMPVYWLFISVAAYRALHQLARDPYLWEKTEHGTGHT